MKTSIMVSNDEHTVHLAHGGQSEHPYVLRMGESETYECSFSEKELRQLQVMIEEILQLVNKRDWN